MVLTDYDRTVLASNCVEAILASKAESRTRYGSSFAAASQIKTGKLRAGFPKFGNGPMKRNPKTTGRLADSTTVPIQYLSNKQKKRIVESWKLVNDRKQLGQRIYMQVFIQKPSLKSLFSFHDVPIDQLKSNAYFTRQSAILGDFLHTMVGFVQMNNENLLRDLCHRVGVRHAQFTSVDFDGDWWCLFVTASLDCLLPYFPPGPHTLHTANRVSSRVMAQLPFLGHWLRDSYKHAWTILLEHSVQLMKQAFADYRLGRLHPSPGPISYRPDTSSGYESGRRIEIRNRYQTEEEEEDQVELQLVIVTTPVEDYAIGEESDNTVTEELYSFGSIRQATTAPTLSNVMPTTFSISEPAAPHSWQTTRKCILHLSSLEDWDSPD